MKIKILLLLSSFALVACTPASPEPNKEPQQVESIEAKAPQEGNSQESDLDDTSDLFGEESEIDVSL